MAIDRAQYSRASILHRFTALGTPQLAVMASLRLG